MSSKLSHGPLDVVSLGVVLAIPWVAHRFAPEVQGPAALVAALGLLLLSGTLTSEIAAFIRVPHLTGYLVAGILAGPYVLHLIDHDTVNKLRPVNTLSLSLIALAGGAELEMSTLKKDFRPLVATTIAQTALGVSLMTGVFFAAHPLIAFTKGMTLSTILGGALLWGVIAIARSPSAALGVISQTRAEGPLARFTLAFVMASDVVVVTMLAVGITLARPLITVGATFSSSAFYTLGHELLGSVAIGITLGIVLALYLRFTKGQLLVVLVALGFGASEVLRYLEYDAMLSFMVAGFVVRNLSQQGPKLLHAIEETGGVVYVVFFAVAGAHLDLPLLRVLWPAALLLAGSRATVTFVATQIANRFSKPEPAVRAWGWAPLVSQAGFAIGIAQIAAREFPELGRGYGDLAIATVALNELVGPILFKFSLERAKETKQPSAALVESDRAPPDGSGGEEPLRNLHRVEGSTLTKVVRDHE